MLGAILGDMVGSPYEFDRNNHKSKDFPLLSEKSHFTDDTVMTVAVARGLMAGQGDLCGGSFSRRCFSAAASPRQNSGCHSSRMPMSAQTIFPHSGAEASAICKGL